MLTLDPAIQKELLPLVGPALAALATLLAVLVSGSFNLWVARGTAATQNKQKEKEIKLAKLEETFTLVAKLENIVEAIHLSYRMCVRNRITYKEFLKDSEVGYEFSDNDGQRLFMLLNMYFPELCDKHKELQKAKWDLLHNLKEPSEAPVDMQELGNRIDTFSLASGRMKSAICATGTRMF